MDSEVIIMAYLKGEKMEISGRLNTKYWVEKSDPLALMRTVPFSLNELKILDIYISRINAADDSKRTVIFTKEEYEKLMGLSCADYRVLKKSTRNLLSKIVELQMPNKDCLQFVLFTKAQYHMDENGIPIIELTCTEEAKDLFFCIGKYHYFKYALENVINLTRKASYLLYLHIMQNRFRNEWSTDLKELRDNILDCKGQESYQEYKVFKRDVLDPAVKEVNAKTNCHFKYESVKIGRRIAKIKFTYFVEIQPVIVKPAEMPQIQDGEYEDEDEKWAKVYGSERLATLAGGCNYEFGKEQMEQISRVLIRINVPRDSLTNSLVYGRRFYLAEKYAALNVEAAKKERLLKQPIKDRFKYFLQMLEEDAFQPNSFTED